MWRGSGAASFQLEASICSWWELWDFLPKIFLTTYPSICLMALTAIQNMIFYVPSRISISPACLANWTLCFQILLKTQFQVLAKRCYNPEEAIKAGNWKIANLCDFLCIKVSNNIFWILVYSVYFSGCWDHDCGANYLVCHLVPLSGCLLGNA